MVEIHEAEDQFETQSPEGDSGSVLEAADRRRPTVASFSFEPDARDLRTLLADVDEGLGYSEPELRRSVRLLVGEIVARMLSACPGTVVQLGLELKADSVRIDISEQNNEPCDFWDALDDTVFSDLTSAWGRDRRGSGGAWFEVEMKPMARQRTDRHR